METPKGSRPCPHADLQFSLVEGQVVVVACGVRSRWIGTINIVRHGGGDGKEGCVWV